MPQVIIWWTYNLEFPCHTAALRILLDELKNHLQDNLTAVGHRIVHGGLEHCEPQRVTPQLLLEFESLRLFAPEHLPQAIDAIATVSEHFPALPQIACFDIAFHRSMPAVTQHFPLSAELWHEVVQRYGFHGLPYKYIVQELATRASPTEAQGRLIITHLGNGATMGFIPTGGLLMSNRSDALDPGAIAYLLKENGLNASELNGLLNRRSGRQGGLGISSDMRELLEKRSTEPRAALAVDMFFYQARKLIGALATVLNGIDTLVHRRHRRARRTGALRNLPRFGVSGYQPGFRAKSTAGGNYFR